MKGSAYGLDTAPGESPTWEQWGACHGPKVDPDWWWPEKGKGVALPRHICLSHCPVLAECSAGAVEGPPDHPQILAGERWVTTKGAASPVRPARRVQAPNAAGCPICGGRS